MAQTTKEPQELKDSEKVKVPSLVEDRIKRSIARMNENAGSRREAWKFWRNEQYFYVNRKGALSSQPTVTDYEGRSGKRPHRQRRVRNMIFDVVEREVSQGNARTPGYEINASTNEPEDIDAAGIAEKVALYGYEQWELDQVREDVIRHAVIADSGGFAWPYFDNSIGPFAETEDGKVGMGDIRVRVYGGNQVGWEPGVPFDDSPYHVITEACIPEEVYAEEGYVGGLLTPDADAADAETGGDKRGAKLVMVTRYLERPCQKYPVGRWITTANGRVIIKERPYPCAESSSGAEPLDRPVLHNLAYARDPDSDHDKALVPYLIDAQRDVNLMVSKQDEWVILALNPQVIIRNGEMMKGQKLTDEPGAVYNVVGSGEVIWRPVPPVPGELSQFKQEAMADVDRISGRSLTDPAAIESGKEAQAYSASDEGRRHSFFKNLARFDSGLMRHCLWLVQEHFSDERLLDVNGRFGVDPIPNFRGAKLRGQMDVRVEPDSLFPRTKKMIEARIMQFAQLGWIGPEQAMAAINSGNGEALIDGFELDKKRAYQVIRWIKDGTFISQPMRPVFPNEDAGPQMDENGEPIVVGMMPGEIDPMTGIPGPPQPQYLQATELPGWMPRQGIDNIGVHKTIFADWLKTMEYDRLPDEQKEAAHLYYAALLDLETKEAQRAMELQSQKAMEQGQMNAAKPQDEAAPLPSNPAPAGQNGSQT